MLTLAPPEGREATFRFTQGQYLTFRATIDGVFNLTFSRDATFLGLTSGYRDFSAYNVWDIQAGKRLKGPAVGRFTKTGQSAVPAAGA